MFPILLLRLVGYFKYRNRDPEDFKDLSVLITIFHNGAYGIWTLVYIVVFFSQSPACKAVRSLSKLNYEMVLIIGIFPAVNTLFFSVLIAVCIPFLLYTCCKAYRAQGE